MIPNFNLKMKRNKCYNMILSVLILLQDLNSVSGFSVGGHQQNDFGRASPPKKAKNHFSTDFNNEVFSERDYQDLLESGNSFKPHLFMDSSLMDAGTFHHDQLDFKGKIYERQLHSKMKSHHHTKHAKSSKNKAAPHVEARAGTNITLACPGVTPTSYIYLVEWRCLGCKCDGCPNPSGEGSRILRFNDKLSRWDGFEGRRELDFERYGLKFDPVTSDDSGTYLCLINNRREPDAPMLLTVRDVPDAPPNRPLVVRMDSRSVDLSWAPPRKNHHHPVESYKIYIKEGEHGRWEREVETGSNSTTFHISGLKPFKTYLFKVAAKNALGYSQLSNESYPTQTHREAPNGSPKFLREKISTSSSSLNLVWQPPLAETINGEFMGYELTYRKLHSDRLTKLSINEDILRIQNYTISNLLKHTDYVITLAVKNLKGIGPNATIELRTEDGVPSEPRQPRFENVTSTSVLLSWLQPSNAINLGSDLLGYRIYIKEKCTDDGFNLEMRRKCKPIRPITINKGSITTTEIDGLSPFTKYQIILRAFTKKREGPASDALVLRTDTRRPGAPIITNITCYGHRELQVEWRRPDAPGSGDSPIKFYKIHLNSRDKFDRMKSEIIQVEIMNDTLRNVAFLANLTTESIYDLKISAFVESSAHPGRLYEGPRSHARRIYLGSQCDPHQAFSKVHENLEMNAGIFAGIVCTTTGLILAVLLLLFCRQKPRYEFLAFGGTPAKLRAANGGGAGPPSSAALNNSSLPTNGGPPPILPMDIYAMDESSASSSQNSGGLVGWYGDPESDIPVSLLPKHVTGLHAGDNMAFRKDFEAIFEEMELHKRVYGGSVNGNGCFMPGPDVVNTSVNVANGKTATQTQVTAFNGNAHITSPSHGHRGGQDCRFVDGWMTPNNFVCVFGENPLTAEATWKIIWEKHVGIIVTILTPADQDELGTLSENKCFFNGDLIVSLNNEDILPDYTIRTMKLTYRVTSGASSSALSSPVKQMNNGSAKFAGMNGSSLKLRTNPLQERFVTQLIFNRWPVSSNLNAESTLLPRGVDLVNFVKASFACRQTTGGRAMIHGGSSCPDAVILYLILECCMAQLRDRGDVNIPSYARHLAMRHGLTLSSPTPYAYVHDVLAEAVDLGLLHSVMTSVAVAGIADSNGSLNLP